MKKTPLLLALLSIALSLKSFCQGPPWNNPLRMAWSTDGVIFNTPVIFQDSAGVPSVIQWKGDTLIAAFQWFRLPNPSATWDRVAIKFSYNNGITWTQPIPIVINGLPPNYQRPFDPALTVINGDSIRIYFSSSERIPLGGLDSSVNTYSAKSADGINFYFEPNPRVDVLSSPVIDPSVIYFNTGWHFLAPIGAPQQGAYHYVSPNGLNFTSVPNIPSDNAHNWTGNFMIESNKELRFYGSGQKIWYNYSPNGGVWYGYTDTNVQGGDPSVVKISSNKYLMIFVGQPYVTGNSNLPIEKKTVNIFPNPSNNFVNVVVDPSLVGSNYTIYDSSGHAVHSGKVNSENISVEVVKFSHGVYFFSVGDNPRQRIVVFKQ
jgi:hypothetical protein